MAKLSASSIKRPSRTTFEKEFQDPPRESDGYKGLTLAMVLRKLSIMEWTAVSDLAAQRTQTYVLGTGDPTKAGYKAPKALIPVDGQPVYVSASTCLIGTAIEYAQVCDDEERYTFEELISFMTADGICAGMSDCMPELEPGEVDPKVSTAGL